MLFTIDFIKNIFPKSIGELDTTIEVNGIMDDSRLKKEQSLFVPIIGEQFNGHQFILSAIEHGAVGSLWQEDEPIPKDVPTSFVFFLVKDTVDALQTLAHAYRMAVDPIVVGVTGSNGKTTTKDLIAAVLKQKDTTYATVGNYNNLIGLPLTILQMNRDTKYLVLEMGMDRFFEIEALSAIARPDYAVITNIGESHIEFLGSRAGIASAKLEIIKGLSPTGQLVIDGDEPLLYERFFQGQQIKCGFKAHNDLKIADINIAENGTRFTLNNHMTYQIPLIGAHHAKNASYAIAIAEKLGMSQALIQEAFNEIEMTGMRFELLQGKHNVTLINDAYNASVTSMKAAIQVMKQLYKNKQKILVLGDMYELGTESKAYHRSVSEVIDDKFAAVFSIGNDANEITNALTQLKNTKILHAKDKAALVTMLLPYLNAESVILFKASRGMKLEEVIHELSEEVMD